MGSFPYINTIHSLIHAFISIILLFLLPETRKEREDLRRELESSNKQEAMLRIAKHELVEEHKLNERSRAQVDQIRTKFLVSFESF